MSLFAKSLPNLIFIVNKTDLFLYKHDNQNEWYYSIL